MADTDKAIKPEDASADSTTRIKVEMTRGRGTDSTSRWDLAQPLDSKQTQLVGKNCPISPISRVELELNDEAGG